MAKKLQITPELLRQLEKEGYQVKRKTTFVRKTFLVEAPILDEFLKVRARLDIKVQDAINAAIHEWTERNKAK